MQVEHIALASDGVIVGGLEWAFLGAVDGGSELAQPLAHGSYGGLVLRLNLSVGHGADIEQQVAAVSGGLDQVVQQFGV